MKGDPGRYDNVQAYREGWERIFGAVKFVPRPADAPPKYNGGIRCDMDRGPCACGATHSV